MCAIGTIKSCNRLFTWILLTIIMNILIYSKPSCKYWPLAKQSQFDYYGFKSNGTISNWCEEEEFYRLINEQMKWLYFFCVSFWLCDFRVTLLCIERHEYRDIRVLIIKYATSVESILFTSVFSGDPICVIRTMKLNMFYNSI